MLRSLRSALAATAAAVVMTAASFAAQAGQDFTVINESSRDIYYLFVSPDYSDVWGNDVLAQDILPAGSSFAVRTDTYGDHCTFDIQVVSRDGETVEFWDVDLCTVSRVIVE